MANKYSEAWQQQGHHGASWGLFCILCGISYREWVKDELEPCEARPFWRWLWHFLFGSELAIIALLLASPVHAQLPPTVAIPEPEWRVPLRDAPLVIDDQYSQRPPIVIQIPPPGEGEDDDIETCRKAKECRDRALHPKWYGFKRKCRRVMCVILRPIAPMRSRMGDLQDMGW